MVFVRIIDAQIAGDQVTVSFAIGQYNSSLEVPLSSATAALINSAVVSAAAEALQVEASDVILFGAAQ